LDECAKRRRQRKQTAFRSAAKRSERPGGQTRTRHQSPTGGTPLSEPVILLSSAEWLAAWRRNPASGAMIQLEWRFPFSSTDRPSFLKTPDLHRRRHSLDNAMA